MIDMETARSVGELAAGLGAGAWAFFTHKSVRKTGKIVQGNGHGNVTAMVEMLLDTTSQTHADVKDIKQVLVQHDGRLDRLEWAGVTRGFPPSDR